MHPVLLLKHMNGQILVLESNTSMQHTTEITVYYSYTVFLMLAKGDFLPPLLSSLQISTEGMALSELVNS